MCAVKPGHERILEFQNIYELLRNLKKDVFTDNRTKDSSGTSKKGIMRLKMSQMSTILMYEVLGRFSDTAMNIVARTLK